MTHRIWRINTAASLSLEWDDAGRVLVSSHDLLAASDSLKHFTLISFRSPSHFFMPDKLFMLTSRAEDQPLDENSSWVPRCVF